jgi:hypothetical protein
MNWTKNMAFTVNDKRVLRICRKETHPVYDQVEAEELHQKQ